MMTPVRATGGVGAAEAPDTRSAPPTPFPRG